MDTQEKTEYANEMVKKLEKLLKYKQETRSYFVDMYDSEKYYIGWSLFGYNAKKLYHFHVELLESEIRKIEEILEEVRGVDDCLIDHVIFKLEQFMRINDMKENIK